MLCEDLAGVCQQSTRASILIHCYSKSVDFYHTCFTGEVKHHGLGRVTGPGDWA